MEKNESIDLFAHAKALADSTETDPRRLDPEYRDVIIELHWNFACPDIGLVDSNNRQVIDLRETGKVLYALRNDPVVRKKICRHSRVYKEGLYLGVFIEPGVTRTNIRRDPCKRNYNCEGCEEYYTDCVSTRSLARYFAPAMTENQIKEIETYTKNNGEEHVAQNISLPKLLLYARLSERPLRDLLILRDGYYLAEDGYIYKEEIKDD